MRFTTYDKQGVYEWPQLLHLTVVAFYFPRCGGWEGVRGFLPNSLGLSGLTIGQGLQQSSHLLLKLNSGW